VCSADQELRDTICNFVLFFVGSILWRATQNKNANSYGLICHHGDF
jgi:hypothetical protein